MRIGEALGLRHEDLEIAQRTLTVRPRSNDNRARAKAGLSRTIPCSAELMRLYADYLTREYGSLDSDYVFVNLWAAPHGRPLTYATSLQMSRVASSASFGKIRKLILPATSPFELDQGQLAVLSSRAS